MNGPDHREGAATVVAVTADTVRRGDVINVGGLHLTVHDMVPLPGGGKRLLFPTGETFTMHQRTLLDATRKAPPPRRVQRRPPPRHASALGSPGRRTP